MFYVRLIGVLTNGAWFGSITAHFFTALNRFCAFVYATKYDQLWSESKALIIGISSWAFGVLFSTQHLYKECSFVFNEQSNYRFSYQTSFFATICSSVDTAVTVIIVMAMAFIDFITLVKIVAYRKAMPRNATMPTSNDISQRDILFFKQSCIFGLLYISCALMFNIAPHVFRDKWFLFVSSTITWIMTQSLDG
ncbi:unnamed protein product [Onchocerca ochengi]|uniref:7TM_GPCR_Srx domain-containing protein n=1 Tax=Onchocerca ochengi TaxID=42157 RepID=A0A182ENF6_ONCOC|nr:unnamed protein product [Onchocerca ochengi]